MDLYRPLCKNIIIPLWAKWEGTNYLDHLKYLDKSQYFKPEKIRNIQWQKIKKLLEHAYRNCDYYRKKFDKEGIDPNAIQSFDDYEQVPILSKEDVIQNSEELMASNVDKYVPFLTSGSTGKPLRGYRDKECDEIKRACGIRSVLWSNCGLGERIYCLYGDNEKELKGLPKLRAKFRRKFLKRTEILDMLKMTEGSMLRFAEKMQKKPPALLWGHAHGLYLLANFYESKGITDICPKGMYSAGMVLHDWERKKVEKVFNCKLQDRYGTEELGLIATECKNQEGLHINTDSHYVEFIENNGKPVNPNTWGAIVVTDLTNMVMPFIRYKIEDVGILSDRLCSCGRTQPLIKKIEGRVADFLITTDGKLVSGISLTDHFAGHIPGVTQIQIIQEEMNRLHLKIVKGEHFGSDSMKRIGQLVREFFGSDMEFDMEYVPEIPKEQSGKYRFTICKVKHNLL